MIKKVFSILLVITVFLSFFLVPVACTPPGEEQEEEGIDMDDAISIVVDTVLPVILGDREGAPYQ